MTASQEGFEDQMYQMLYRSAAAVWKHEFSAHLLASIENNEEAKRSKVDKEFITKQFRLGVMPNYAAKAYAEKLGVKVDLKPLDSVILQAQAVVYEDHFKSTVYIMYPNIISNPENSLAPGVVRAYAADNLNVEEAAKLYLDANYPNWHADPGKMGENETVDMFYYDMFPTVHDALAKLVKMMLGK